MAARRIREEEVEAVISEPEFVTPGKGTPEKGPSKVLWKTVAGRRLKVVVSDTDPPRVITVAVPEE